MYATSGTDECYPPVVNVDTPQSQSTVPQSAPMRVKARPFGGEISWKDYRSHFERVCRINGWHEKLDYLWVNLTGTALAYAESLPAATAMTYEDLCDALNGRFGVSQRAEVYKSELRSRQRMSGESLPALGQSIRQLVQNAYPGIGMQGCEELAVEKFREALTDSEQRMSVHRSHARSLDEAIKAAMDAESWQISERRSTPHRVRAMNVGDEDAGILHYLEKIDTRVQALEDKSRNANKCDLVCFYCNKPGHIARNCFKKRQDDRSKQQENSPQLS